MKDTAIGAIIGAFCPSSLGVKAFVEWRSDLYPDSTFYNVFANILLNGFALAMIISVGIGCAFLGDKIQKLIYKRCHGFRKELKQV